METFNIDTKQSAKQYKMNCDKLAYILHSANNSTIVFEPIIENYTIDKMIKTNHNGIISNLLTYFISTNNIISISYIIEFSSDIMMKRDYFHLIKYYYKDSTELACDIFKTKVLQFEILSKDIDYILENELFELFNFLIGSFVKTTNDDFPIIISPHEFKKFTISMEQMYNILKQVEEEGKITSYNNFDESITHIIDGGSVIHNRNGMICKYSLSDLLKLAKQVENPIVIIHKRHTKTIPNLLYELTSNKIKYCLTPPNVNDDLYILSYFLKLGTKPFIITNDKYRDHIFKFEKSKNTTFGLSQFKDVIEQQTINFSMLENKLIFKSPFSFCIQKITDGFAIPHIDNNMRLCRL